MSFVSPTQRNDMMAPGQQQLGGTAVQAQVPQAPQSSGTTGATANYGSLFQPGYLGAPATTQATTAAPGTVNLGQLFSGWQGASQLSPGLTNSLGAGSTIQQLLAGLQPQAQNASNQLTQTLADYGVGGGQAVGAQDQLQSQLMASIAPSIASAIQNSQANQLGAGEFNSGAQNTNTNALNSIFGSTLGQNANNLQSTNQFNAGQLNTSAQNNANAMNSTNAANVGQYNQSNATTLQDLMSQYYAQLGAFNQINTGGQTAGNQNAVNYGQDITVSDPFAQIFGPLMGAAGQASSSFITPP
jgi:hypothetical protein